MARILAVVNQKGGVGKTTTTANLAAGIADMGKKVLLIDLDAQANLSAHFGVSVDEAGADENGETKSMYDVLKHEAPLSDVIVSLSDNLSIAPASLFLSAADLELGAVIGRELLLRKSLKPVADDYDYIFMDCPPSLGLLSLNGLVAATEVVIPVQSEYLALHGVRQLLDTVDQVRSAYNPSLKVGGVLLCLHDARKRLSRSVAETIREYFGDLVFNTIIRSNVALAEAPSQGTAIYQYDSSSNGAKDYRELSKELVSRGA